MEKFTIEENTSDGQEELPKELQVQSEGCSHPPE